MTTKYKVKPDAGSNEMAKIYLFAERDVLKWRNLLFIKM
jgi:hypothetical protein